MANGAAPEKTAEKKQVYVTPEIIFDEQLEVVAVSCMAPAKANPGACPAGPINS